MNKEKEAAGIVLTRGEKIYFIPHRVLEGFSVEHPAGQEVLRKAIAEVPAHNAYAVTVDRDILQQIFIL